MAGAVSSRLAICSPIWTTQPSPEANVTDIRITSWNELNKVLYADSWKESLGRFRSSLAFRGMGDARYDLKTSLMQLGDGYEQHEGHILRNFRKYARREAVSEDSVWNWLALAQHHGLPSRLLDWTYSPYVALHFATENLDRFNVDGIVWCVNYVRTHELLPQRLRELLRAEGAEVFTAEMLDQAARTLDEFGALAPDPFALFLEPPSLDARIVNQFALFSLMSSAHGQLDRWLEAHPQLYRRVIIPADLKWEVRDKLDQANITERVLFPGLDGLSRWLKRYYSTRRDRPSPIANPSDKA
jgi:hypothetical protein